MYYSYSRNVLPFFSINIIVVHLVPILQCGSYVDGLLTSVVQHEHSLYIRCIAMWSYTSLSTRYSDSYTIGQMYIANTVVSGNSLIRTRLKCEFPEQKKVQDIFARHVVSIS